MREIDYRAMNIDGEWEYGEPCVIFGFLPRMFSIRKRSYVYIKRNTVSQFTGVLDKNGKKIYEGDILEIIPSCIYESRMVVEHLIKHHRDGSQHSGFMLNENDTHYDFFNSEKMLIIGNIFDNPELLKGGGK